MPDGLLTPYLPDAELPPSALARKGRGAASNPAVRYDRTSTLAFDDGWETLTEDLNAPPPLRTTLARDASRSALAWNDSPDIGFDRSLNPYRGCEHGCVYCFARPSHAYLGLSPGLDFESRLTFKPDLPQLLERELRKPGYVPKPVALGSNTDPYQPVERRLEITRKTLLVLEKFQHPLTIVTKSAGVLRDIDILSRMARQNLVQVCLSVTTLDNGLARKLEPRAATPQRRLDALRSLAEAGIPTAVLAAPMIPGLNDAEMERILEAAAATGVRRAGYVLLRLPLEISQMFEEWLQVHTPDRARHVLSLVRQTRQGALYRSKFGERMSGTGPYAELLAQRFRLALRRVGLEGGYRAPLDCSRFAPPPAAGDQLALL